MHVNMFTQSNYEHLGSLLSILAEIYMYVYMHTYIQTASMYICVYTYIHTDIHAHRDTQNRSTPSKHLKMFTEHMCLWMSREVYQPRTNQPEVTLLAGEYCQVFENPDPQGHYSDICSHGTLKEI